MKVSVITVCLNDKVGLEKTIQSVLGQTFSDFEMVIADGGSDDGSTDVIRKYENRIAKWVSEKDNGIYHAMNKGIEMSSGQYCLFLNAGDFLYDKNVLRKIVEGNPDADIVYGDMYLQDKKGNLKFMESPGRVGVFRMYADTLWHPVSFISRSLFEKYGAYDPSYRIAGDYEFFCRVILDKKAKLHHVPVAVAVFDESGVSSSIRSRVQLLMERKRAQDKYFNPVLLFFFRLYSKLRN